VVGLDGTGDRSFGTTSGSVQTVRSITNLLRNFHIEVPGDRLLVRNVAAVLVTAEVSPYLRPGSHFEVQVASIGDATSLRGGQLYIAPMGTAPDQPAVASAQGSMPAQLDEQHTRFSNRNSGSGRVIDGGVLELPLASQAKQPDPTLVLRSPDLPSAARIVAVINAARGAGTARVEDAGSIALKLPAQMADSAQAFLAALDTLPVTLPAMSRIIIDAHSGLVVAGGDVHVGSAVVSLKGITVRVGGDSLAKASPGVVSLNTGASVRDVAVGLQAMGALPSEVAAVFDGLRAAGAITAAVIIR
jgi:flagellar P-ring protein precursor FlgI